MSCISKGEFAYLDAQESSYFDSSYYCLYDSSADESIADQEHQDQEQEDEQISTIIPIGMPGSGKSTLANILALEDDQIELSNLPIFETSSQTLQNKVQARLVKSEKITHSLQMRIIDVPPISPQVSLNEIRKQIIRETSYLKLITIVLSAKSRSLQKSTIDMISLWEQMVGPSAFWAHACIVITHWSYHPDTAKQRNKQGLGDDQKEQGIMQGLRARFSSMNQDCPVFFVDAFDLGMPYDRTRTQATKICQLAQKKMHFPTQKLQKIGTTHWRQSKDNLLKRHSEVLQGYAIQALNKAERELFTMKSNQLLEHISSDLNAMSLSKKEFADLVKQLEKLKGDIVKEGTSRMILEKQGDDQITQAKKEEIEQERERIKFLQGLTAQERVSLAKQIARVQSQYRQEKTLRAIMWVLLAVSGWILMMDSDTMKRFINWKNGYVDPNLLKKPITNKIPMPKGL